MNSNDINHDAYNNHIDVYLEKNQGGVTGGLTPSRRVSNFVRYLKSGRVLEIGSGQGLDALELQEKGFEVTASDFVESFLALLKSKGLDTAEVNLKEPHSLEWYKQFDGKYALDGIYANAVFVHFSPKDLELALAEIHDALKSNGYLFFSLLIGEGSEISDRMSGVKREFFYYKNSDLQKLLEKYNFTIDEMNSDDEPIDGRWIHCICHRI
jgi:SAM-dependent methyltransferase